ncbi:MAG: hypothetical protein ACRELA_20875 [Candidatus Rokuibacteriota bacterium]
MDRAGVPVGVVTAIAAPSRFRVTVRGRQDHAGGTLMGSRRDALATAAEVVLAVERIARETGRGTVGTLDVRPNMVNIVPGEVHLLADFRGIESAPIAESLARFEAVADEIAARRSVTVEVVPIIREQPLAVAPDMAAAADAVGIPSQQA